MTMPIPVGPEIQVNTQTIGFQFAPSVTTLADGGWVVTWTSGGDEPDIYQQRYDRNGGPVGGETLVNTLTSSIQSSSSVIGLADGGWVVTWHSFGGDYIGNPYSGYGICQQRYDANGVAIGGERVVNEEVNRDQTIPSAAALVDGGWVVTWTSADGSPLDVRLQRFDAQGATIDGQVRVNAFGYLGRQSSAPVVSGLADGGWVVAWQTNDGWGSVYQQRYDADGRNVGGESLVNTHWFEEQGQPSISSLADGGWIVVWMSTQDNGSGEVYQQRYAADGTPVGGETRVNVSYGGDQDTPSVIGRPDGGWIVTWESGWDVLQRTYDADGNAEGDEMRISASPEHPGFTPIVNVLSDGSWLVTWTADNGDGSQTAIFQQRFSTTGLQIHTLTTGDDTIDGGAGPTRVLAAPATLTAGDELAGGDGVDSIEMQATGVLDLTLPVALAGFERLLGTSGDDTFVFDAARLAAFTSIGGGGGQDTLRLSGGGTVSLVGRSLAGIEAIVLTDAAGTALHVTDTATALLADAHLGAADTLIVDADLSLAARKAIVAQGFEAIRHLSLGNVVETSVGQDAITESTVDSAHSATWASQTLTYTRDYDLLGIDRTTDTGWHITYSFAGGKLSSARFVDVGDVHPSIAEYGFTYVDGVPVTREDLLDNGDVRETTFTAGRRTAVVLRDANHDAPWASITKEYATDGTTPLSRTVEADNRDTTRRDYVGGVLAMTTIVDVSGTHAYERSVTRYDAAGVRISTLLVMDDGDTLETTYVGGVRTELVLTDVDDDQSYTVKTEYFAADGKTPALLETQMGDGTVHIRSYLPDRTLRTTDADDVLSGVSGRDVFVLTPGGHDTVTNFQVGVDSLDLTAFGFSDAGDLAAAVRSVSATSIEIVLSLDESVLLRGVAIGDFASLDLAI